MIFVGTFSMMIPYLTGIVTEKHFLAFYQSSPPNQTVKTLEHVYQRGWFGSFAQAVVEIPKTLPIENDHRFLLTHQIKHGWVPIQSVFIHTILYPYHQLNLATQVSSQLEATNTLPEQEKPWFDIQTRVQTNGDSVSELFGSPLTLSLETMKIQGQQLQGEFSVKNQSSLLTTNLDGYHWQITNTDQHFIIPQWILNGTLQIEDAQPLQGQGDLLITQLQLNHLQSLEVTLAKIKSSGINYQLTDHLAFTATTQIAQIQIENDSIGPATGEIMVQHWHLSSLSNLLNKWMQMSPTQLSSSQFKMSLLQLVPQGIVFLQNTPALQINAFKLQTPEGKVTGNLQLQVQPFKFSPFMLFKPALFLQYVQGSLDLMVPRALLESSETPTTSAARIWVEERLKAWQNRKILIPAPNQPDYYITAMQLNNGILQVNGEQRAIDVLRVNGEL
jgi:hypothetical protein